MSEAEKQAQINEMWEDHIHGPWWRLYTYYHRRFRGERWPEWARREVEAAKAQAEAMPQGKS
jgi:hypothetical protein